MSATPPAYMHASELARLAGVSTDTLRHYERQGVLARPRRAPNGYRLYSPDALARVLLVRRALAVGFTLDELTSILEARDKGAAPCTRVRALAAEKLAEVEARIQQAEALRDDLRKILQTWDEILACTAEGAQAHLLEGLATNHQSLQASPLLPSERWRKPRKNYNNES